MCNLVFVVFILKKGDVVYLVSVTTRDFRFSRVEERLCFVLVMVSG